MVHDQGMTPGVMGARFSGNFETLRDGLFLMMNDSELSSRTKIPKCEDTPSS